MKASCVAVLAVVLSGASAWGANPFASEPATRPGASSGGDAAPGAAAMNDSGPGTGASAGAATRPAGAGLEFALERARRVVTSVSLSDEQRKRADDILAKARDEAEKMKPDLAKMDARERLQQGRAFLDSLRQDLVDVLTPEQREQARQKLEAERAASGIGPMGEAGGGGRAAGEGNGRATTRPADRTARGSAGTAAARPGEARGPVERYVERLNESLQKLDLSDEQKGRVKDVLDDMRTRVQGLRETARNDMEEARAKGRQILQDTRQKLADILTPEQQRQLREAMQRGGGPAAGNGGAGAEMRDRAQRGRDGAATRPSAGGEMNMMDSSSAGSKERKAKAEDAAPAPKGPAVGEPAPDVSLTRLDGDGGKVQLSALKGRIVVLVFGSYSSPSFRQRAAALEKLRGEVGVHAQVFVVYSREAHAAGEWEVDRNKDDDVSVEQPKTLEARRALAQTAKEKLKLTTPIAIDSIDNDAARALGAGENSAFVIGRDGTILARQQWFEPAGLRRALDKALADKTSADRTDGQKPATRPAA